MALSMQTLDLISRCVPRCGNLSCPDRNPLQGMKRFHARVEVVKRLKELGLYIETKDNPMPIPICRCVLHLCHGAILTFLQ